MVVRCLPTAVSLDTPQWKAKVKLDRPESVLAEHHDHGTCSRQGAARNQITFLIEYIYWHQILSEFYPSITFVVLHQREQVTVGEEWVRRWVESGWRQDQQVRGQGLVQGQDDSRVSAGGPSQLEDQYH